MNKINISYGLMTIIWIVLHINFGVNQAALADDLSHFSLYEEYRNGTLSIREIFENYFNDPNRFSRPLSAISVSTFTLLSISSPTIFFLWGIIFIGYIYLLKKILESYIKNEWVVFLICFLALFFPLSSSNVYSFVMHTIQLIIGLFFISIILIRKENVGFHILAGFLILSSYLLYEQNLFLIPIIFIVTFLHNKTKIWIKLLLTIVFPLLGLFFYRKFIAPEIFENYFDYGASKIEVSTHRLLELFIAIGKLFTSDTAYILYKSVLSITEYSYTDYVLLLLGIILSYITTTNISKSNFSINKSTTILFISFFLLTIVLFSLSKYPPIAFGFENRILLWVRFSSMILFGIFIKNILFKNKRFIYISKTILFLILSLNIITIISQKNSWISASEYNKTAIRNLERNFLKNQQNTKIIYLMDKDKKESLITDESILEADYEINSAQKLYTKANFNPNNIIFANPVDYSLYEVFGIKLNKRYKTEFKINEQGIKTGKNVFLTYPFYIFNEKNNQIHLVNSKNNFQKIIYDNW